MCQRKNDIKLRRLKGRSKIKSIFHNGKSYRYQNLLLRLEKKTALSFLAVGVSVSKKDFPRAIDRNKIKRHLRNELNKINHNIIFCGYCMVFYDGEKIPEKDALSKQMKGLLKKANKAFIS